MRLDPVQSLDLEFLSGTIAVVAPHMDDEVLACGGLIARLPQKNQIHVIYATDGMKSPAPLIPGRDQISPDLGQIRMRESTAAMKLLGLPEQNLHFLCFPEGELMKYKNDLLDALRASIRAISPDFILVPFRFDRHPDHLAINHAITSDLEEGQMSGRMIEYFVYYRWRLMPKRDIRKYIPPRFLNRLDISEVASLKRKALDCFVSQTTIYYSWQTRPILTPTLLDEECQNPEMFLMPHASAPGAAVFSSAVLWIRVVHRIEPILQRWKYRTGAFLKRMVRTRV